MIYSPLIKEKQNEAIESDQVSFKKKSVSTSFLNEQR